MRAKDALLYLKVGVILASAAYIGYLAEALADASATDDALNIRAAFGYSRSDAIPDNESYLKPGAIGNIFAAYDIHPFVEYPPDELLERHMATHKETKLGREGGLLGFPITIEKGQTLREGLDTLRTASEGLLDWRVLHGTVCVFPVKLETIGMAGSPLDVPVTLQMDRVSTWDLFKGVGIQVNRALGEGVFQISFAMSLATFGDNRDLPEEEHCPTIWGSGPPPWFHEDKTVSLHVENVSAREAICAILAASPAPVKVTSRYHPDLGIHRLGITFLWNEYSPGAPMLAEDRLHWMREEYTASGRDPKEAALFYPPGYTGDYR